jgi:CelD/BcsL family acetyltransferase involved in cellulose biosynthesis
MGHQKLQVRELGRDWVHRAADAWTRLLQSSDAHPVFASWAWISSWLETFGDTQDFRLVGLFEEEALVAVLPLRASRPAVLLRGVRLSLAGDGQVGADYSDAVCARGYEDAAAQAVAAWLSGRDGWTQCEFLDVLPGSVVRRVANLMPGDFVTEDLPGSVCPRVSLGSGWEGLLRSRFDRKRRYNIERQMRLAETTQGLSMVLHDTPETIGPAFSLLTSLHKQRKQAQGIESKFSRTDSLEFHGRAAARLAESRSAFVATLESGQGAVVAAYCLRDSSSVYYFQTGMSPAGAALGAGSTLLCMLMRWAARRGYAWFDLLKGDEDYKRNWATDRVEQRLIRITRANARGRLALAVQGARRKLRHLYDRGIRYARRTA